VAAFLETLGDPEVREVLRSLGFMPAGAE